MSRRAPRRFGRAGVLAWATLAALALSPGASLSADDETTLVYPPFGHCLGLHRVTDFHRFIYLGTRTKLDDPTGIAAVKLLAKDDPSTESDDDELTVFGLNTGRCEIIYNKSLYEAAVYGECGGGEGQFRRPMGIAADEHGNIFVADTGNDRIVRLRYSDEGLRWIKTFGSTGSGERQLVRPTAIALGASGTVYVCDAGNDRVAVMTGGGEIVRYINGDEEAGVSIEDPVGMAVVENDDPWISRGRGMIALSDRGGRRVMTFDLDGRFQSSIESGRAAGEPRFESLAIDFYGNVYATDRAAGMIHKLDRELRYVDSFGRTGDDDGEFDDPRGIAIWRRFGQVFVTERTGAQYLWIGTEIQNLSVEPLELTPGGEPLRMAYDLTETSRVSLALEDDRGREVALLVDNRRRPIGHNTERWDGVRGAPPEGLAPGTYTLVLEARPTYSSGQYFQDTAEIEIRLVR